MNYTRQQLRDYLKWDINTWKQALLYWDDVLSQELIQDELALELGARDGGLALYLAGKDMRVICSDLEGPSVHAPKLFERNGLTAKASFESIDATAIPYEDNHFKVVLFKSMLGGIGMFCGFEGIQRAISEIYRVLQPGGLLLFAENQAGSLLHQQARRHFVDWGKTWLYPTLDQFETLLAPFDESVIRSYGFFSCFKKDFAPFVAGDRLVCRSEKSHRHYMVFGHARKLQYT